jgi:hypothetical protein
MLRDSLQALNRLTRYAPSIPEKMSLLVTLKQHYVLSPLPFCIFFVA